MDHYYLNKITQRVNTKDLVRLKTDELLNSAFGESFETFKLKIEEQRVYLTDEYRNINFFQFDNSYKNNFERLERLLKEEFDFNKLLPEVMLKNTYGEIIGAMTFRSFGMEVKRIGESVDFQVYVVFESLMCEIISCSSKEYIVRFETGSVFTIENTSLIAIV